MFELGMAFEDLIEVERGASMSVLGAMGLVGEGSWCYWL